MGFRYNIWKIGKKSAISYCNISKKTRQEFGNDTKRNFFLSSFYVKDYTSTILESSADYTDTFIELLTFIRRRISRDENLNSSDAMANTNLTHANENTPNTPHDGTFTQHNARVMRNLTHAANNAASRNNNQTGSWRVLDNLWRIATPEQINVHHK